MKNLETYHTNAFRNTQAMEDERHRSQIQQVLKDVENMFQNKGEDYNNLTTFIENMILGDASWITLLVIKAHRLASVFHKGSARYDSKADIVLDIIVYAVCYLAWLQMKESEE